jgi:glycosyltransferase involved in cell wall biosynthesis
MTKAKAVVVPSLYEPFGLSALEGMKACIPVIASDTGGLPEIVHHFTTGLTFRPGDSIALAFDIKRIVQDPLLGASMTKAGYELAKDYNWMRVAGMVREVYNELIP